MIRALLVTMVVLATLLAAGCGGDGDGEGRDAGARDAAPPAATTQGIAAVTLRGIDGSDRKVGDYQGRIVMISLVATWQGDSKAIVEIMNEIQRKFQRHVTVIAVSMDDRGVEGARSFVQQTGAAFDLFLGDESVKREFGSPRQLPVTYVLTRDAQIFAKIEGLQRYERYHDTIIRMYQLRM